MIISNIETVPGRDISEDLGLVMGSTVRAKHVGRDIAAFFKSIIGGELVGYSELLVEGREAAIARMQAEAEERGADAVINVRLATSSITSGAAELLAYGTAVKLTDTP